MLQTVKARRLYTAEGAVEHPTLVVEDGRVREITSGEPNGSTETLTSAFFDIHVHGAVGHDLMHASSGEIAAISRFLAGKGVAHYLPTTVTAGIETTLQSLDRLARHVAPATTVQDGASAVGIHLEGPFLCAAKRGVHPVDQLLAPSIAAFERFQEAAQGHIRLVTMAPDMPGALELIAYLHARGIRVSMGHSNATFDQAEAAIRAGATSATHTFNAMRAVDHREPGLAVAVLDSHEVYAEAIVDGVHIHPAMVRLWLRAKGEDRAMLVTDGMAATGMPDGTYSLGDVVVEVAGHVARAGGALAGSVLTLDQAVQNLRRFTTASLATAVRLASRNPAEMLGMPELVRIAPGAPANFNVYSEEGVRLGSYLNGKRLSA